MVFSAVATGYLLKEHGSVIDYIHVICKALVNSETGQIYEGKEIDRIIEETEDCVHNGNNIPKNYDLILHDDITETEDGYVYKENHKIKIGETHSCAIMIYLSIVSKFDDETMYYYFTDQDLVDLMKWKNCLVQQGRIPVCTFFASVPNCCS